MLRFGRDLEVDAWLIFWKWVSIKICIWTVTLVSWTQPSDPFCLWQCNVLVMALVEALVAPKLDVAVDKNKWDLWQLTRTPLILNKGFWKQSIAWGRRWMPLTRMPGAFQLEISNVSIFTCFFKAFWPSTPWLLLRARKKSLVMPSKKWHCHQKCEWQNN